MAVANQLLVFALDEQRYALHLSAVDRVVPMVTVTPLPAAPDAVLGIFNLQGRIVPVFDMRRRFRLAGREIRLSDQLIIAHTTRRWVALVTDAVGDVLDCPARDVVEAQRVLPGTDYVEGVAKLEDGLILIHDLDKFLSLNEEKLLERAISNA
ncbi:MAG: chemotaxis protein CheW [Burkholderiales bacterium]